MFTGLVERVGIIQDRGISACGEDHPGDLQLTITLPDPDFLHGATLGESISVSGVCLTVVELSDRHFVVQVVAETLRRSTLGRKAAGSAVNLERALLPTTRLGGHFVQGHVDGVATVSGVRPEGDGLWVTFEPPFDLLRYVVEKGSVCLDGVSLTVANLAYKRFSVALIPHTRAVTTAAEWQPGYGVNLEVDILAKHLERLQQWHSMEKI